MTFRPLTPQETYSLLCYLSALAGTEEARTEFANAAHHLACGVRALGGNVEYPEELR